MRASQVSVPCDRDTDNRTDVSVTSLKILTHCLRSSVSSNPDRYHLFIQLRPSLEAQMLLARSNFS
jgi:hypothetical protein